MTADTHIAEPADYRGIFYQEHEKAIRMAYHYVALEVTNPHGFRFFPDSHENAAIFQFLVPMIKNRLVELEEHIAAGGHKGSEVTPQHLRNVLKIRDSLKEVEGCRIEMPQRQIHVLQLIHGVERNRKLFGMEALVNDN